MSYVKLAPVVRGVRVYGAVVKELEKLASQREP